MGRRLAVLLLALMSAACSLLPAGEPGPPDLIALRLDGRQAELRWTAAQPRSGEIDRASAEAAARSALGASAEGAVPVDAKLVVLTERTPDDQVTAIDQRRVWLVTLKGASFPIDACACDGTPLKLGTLAVIGVGDGALVARYGISRD